MIRWLWIGLFCIESVQASAVRVEQLGVDQGLPGSIVKDILNDEAGYLWIATAAGLARTDGYRITSVPLRDATQSLKEVPDVRNLITDAHGKLWATTREQGLYQINHDHAMRLRLQDQGETVDDRFQTGLSPAPDGTLWLATLPGLLHVQADGKVIERIDLFESEEWTVGSPGVQEVHLNDQGQLWVGTSDGLKLRTPGHSDFKDLIPESGQSIGQVHVIHSQHNGPLWVGAETGVYQVDTQTLQMRRFDQIEGLSQIYALESTASELFIGTLYDGLYRWRSDETVEHFGYDAGAETSLDDNVIYALHIDPTGSLWIGTFNAGINRVDLATQSFGLYDDGQYSLPCLPSRVVYELYEDRDQSWWIGTEYGVAHLDADRTDCRIFEHRVDDPLTLSHKQPYDILRDSSGTLWISTARGLNRVDEVTQTIDRLEGQVPRILTYFIHEWQPGQLILGTSRGLYRFDVAAQRSILLGLDQPDLTQASFIDSVVDESGKLLMATSRGLIILSEQDVLMSGISLDRDAIDSELDSIQVDARGRIWAGLKRVGLIELSPGGRIIRQFHTGRNGQPVQLVGNIEVDRNGWLWLGTSDGLVHLNPDTGLFQRHVKADGLQGNVFTRGSSHRGAQGHLYMGGREGFNRFKPSDISINSVPPRLVLTGFSRFNEWQSTEPSEDGFQLPAPISELEQLEIGHRDYVIGIEFAALHYADPSRNQFQYQLEGFDPGWTNSDASNRHVTYTNLPAGQYRFRVRAANKDGVWSDQEAVLGLRVRPPPWLSPWAFAAYAICLLLLTLGTVQIRTVTSRRRAIALERQVRQRTREVAEQKATIESLLARKNELFANVSHEFRTPLTLILGPLEKLHAQMEDSSAADDVAMVRRNAMRLLHLVEQLLKLASLDRQEPQERVVEHVSERLQFMLAAYHSAAADRNIRMSLDAEPQLQIEVAPDTVDTVVGNLLSNAIKFTPEGGQIDIIARADQGQLLLQVRDSGPGLSEEEQQLIFERFTRLKQHQHQMGTGIGLALVKGLIESQGGRIEVRSGSGQGTSFRVHLPLATDPELAIAASDRAVTSRSDSLPEVLREPGPVQRKLQKSGSKTTALIIEDNTDMQRFILDAIGDQYRCLVADDGQQGVAQALQEIPDIIVSDVMMPAMDGFQVSRVLRNDPRTSHIPIILLTARGDKDSRMAGWREQVDEYLTKPFDADELLERMHNLLTIRALLRQRAGERMVAGEVPDQLNKTDKAFVDALNKSIAQHFQDSLYGRAEMAASVAVSERQLQRKLKGLIDKNPSELLREYRLIQAAQRLRDGKQVSVVADDCGFSSPSHFSQSFKSRYGMTPKQYQKQGN